MQSKKTEASNELTAERRAAVYVREAAVQPGQSALDAQVDACVLKADEDGEPPVGAAYVFRDQGSGLQLDRRGLNQLRRAVQAGEVGVVYVYSPGRLSRSFNQLALLHEEFASAGVEIRFVRGSFDTNLRGRFPGLADPGVYGFAYDKVEMPPTHDEQQAGTVRSISALFHEGWSLADIAAYLNETELPTERWA